MQLVRSALHNVTVVFHTFPNNFGLQINLILDIKIFCLFGQSDYCDFKRHGVYVLLLMVVLFPDVSLRVTFNSVWCLLYWLQFSWTVHVYSCVWC